MAYKSYFRYSSTDPDMDTSLGSTLYLPKENFPNPVPIKRKSGAHWGPNIAVEKRTFKDTTEKNKYDQYTDWMYDQQSNIFKNPINGYKGHTNSDLLEDPSFLIFDVQLDTINSPLFNISDSGNTLNKFLSSYKNIIPELNERTTTTNNIYNEFRNILFKIFPTTTPTSNSDLGFKQHYIESISGLENLNKKIINYPEDSIIITLSDDVTMLTQYLSELYNNMVYSYDTHRSLIPENLLRFNLKLIVSDFRDMRHPKFGISGSTDIRNNETDYSTQSNKLFINSSKSKMIYIFHDCQFNFFETKSFGDELIRAGINQTRTSTPSKNVFKMNFKSISKITAPLLIDKSIILDFKERETRTSNDITLYKTPYNKDIKEFYMWGPDDNKKKTRGVFGSLVNNVKGQIVNKLMGEVTELTGAVSNFMANTFGFTILKTNVYKDDFGVGLFGNKFGAGSLGTKMGNMFSDFAGKIIDKGTDKMKEGLDNLHSFVEEGINNAIDFVGIDTGKLKSFISDPFGKNNASAINGGKDNLYGLKPSSYEPSVTSISYSPSSTSFIGDTQSNSKYHDKDPNNTLNNKGKYTDDVYPDILETLKIGDVMVNMPIVHDKTPDNTLNTISYTNDVYPLIPETLNIKGVMVNMPTLHNKKPNEIGFIDDVYPSIPEDLKIGDVYVNTPSKHTKIPGSGGTSTDVYPNIIEDLKIGDVYINRPTYNQKFPEGDLHPKGQYNQKFPKGDLMTGGTYHDKKPIGDLHPKGSYNEKYPEGDLHPNGSYNEKYPEGDLHPNGKYNTKYPKGDLHPNGSYNEKYPEGDLHPNGKYNTNKPSGDLHPDGKYNNNKPSGDLHPDGKYNTNKPNGDLHPDGIYNEKYPKGNVYKK